MPNGTVNDDTIVHRWGSGFQCFCMNATRLFLLLMALWLSGCADTRYYWQSLRGQWQLMQAAEPIAQLLTRDDLAPPLRQRLMTSQAIRDFAVTDLHLPDNASYRRYADLQRPYAVWNVVAAPEMSLQPRTWCFPVAGCVSYRGYFAKADALAQADALRSQGLEVHVYGVPAYSTLGWLNRLGGDPLLNTWVNYPDGDLARLMFHELAHQVLYVPDDTMFNESFATAVERLGVQRWLQTQATPDTRDIDARLAQRRQEFRDLTRRTRDALRQIYAAQPTASGRAEAKAMKKRAMQAFRDAYAQLKLRWGGYAGYDDWVAQANNASFAAQAAYDQWVPGFEALFVREGRDWRRFFDAVRQLSQQDAAARAAQLDAWTGAAQSASSALAISTSSRSMASIGWAQAASW